MGELRKVRASLSGPHGNLVWWRVRIRLSIWHAF